MSIQAQIINLLQNLQQRFGLSYLFIAHDLAVVRHISDRVAVMYLGKLVEIADKKTIYAGPLHPYTQALMAAIPKTDPTLAHQARHAAGRRAEPVQSADRLPLPYPLPACAGALAVEEPKLREAAPGHRLACHFFETLPPPVIVARSGPPTGKFAERLAAFETQSRCRRSPRLKSLSFSIMRDILLMVVIGGGRSIGIERCDYPKSLQN